MGSEIQIRAFNHANGLTVYPPLTPPRRGISLSVQVEYSPPGRGQGWIKKLSIEQSSPVQNDPEGQEH